jgi:O-antigen/teichoic acid export membrane protein
MLTTRFARNSGLNAVSGASILLASLFSGIVVARLLGTEGAGTVAFALWIASMITPVIGGGMSAGIGRSLPELTGRGEIAQAQAFSGWLSRRLLAYVLLALTGFIATISIEPSIAARIAAFLASDDSGGQSRVLLLLLPILIVGQVMAVFGNSYLRGLQAFGRLARLSVVSLLLQVILRDI